MPGQPPPSRYRIYERHRRLVVVDSWANPSTGGMVAPPAQKMPGGKLQRIAFDGRTAFTTHQMFDTKGPRTITLDPGSASVIGGVKVALVVGAAALVALAFIWPYFLLPLILLLQRRFRNQLRAGATAWLDRASR